MKMIRMITYILIVALGFAVTACQADNSTSANNVDQKQVEQIVKNYLLQNPEVIVQAVQNLQQKQMDQARKSIEKTQEIIPKYAADIFNQSGDPVAGNANGKMTLVEFFDYQCPHCVAMSIIIDSLVQSNNNLKVIFKEFPIRGPVSELAARAALASNLQGKYLVFHRALMKASDKLSEDEIFKLAKSVGLNVDQLKADMNSADVDKVLKGNIQLAQNLGLFGTPVFFVAKSSIVTEKNPSAKSIGFIPGRVEKPQLESVIQKISEQ